MRLFMALLLLALVCTLARAGRGTARRRKSNHGNRSNAAKRFAPTCKEYFVDGDKYLDCQNQHLTAVLLGWPEDIDHLLLARNKIQVLRDNTFKHFRNLESLDLQLNEISHIEDGAFSGLRKLTTLLLQHNRLQVVMETMFIPMPQLRHLRLHDNPWKCECELDSLVRFLQVPSNHYMGTYAKCAEPSKIWGKSIKTLDPNSLCQPFQPLQQTLCHQYNIPKPTLDCSSKQLNDVPTGISTNIMKLDLSFNNITELKPEAFVTTKDLKLLNLSSNNLENIKPGAFVGLLHLRELDLSNNSLRYFNYGVLEDLYYLRMLSLGNNPWICDYNIHYLTYWLKHHPSVSHTGLVCSAPEEFHGWPVESYVKTYNDDCPKDRQVNQNSDAGLPVTTPQELTVETDEDQGLLPSHLRGQPNRFEIFRLT